MYVKRNEDEKFKERCVYPSWGNIGNKEEVNRKKKMYKTDIRTKNASCVVRLQ